MNGEAIAELAARAEPGTGMMITGPDVADALRGEALRTLELVDVVEQAAAAGWDPELTQLFGSHVRLTYDGTFTETTAIADALPEGIAITWRDERPLSVSGVIITGHPALTRPPGSQSPVIIWNVDTGHQQYADTDTLQDTVTGVLEAHRDRLAAERSPTDRIESALHFAHAGDRRLLQLHQTRQPPQHHPRPTVQNVVNEGFIAGWRDPDREPNTHYPGLMRTEWLTGWHHAADQA